MLLEKIHSPEDLTGHDRTIRLRDHRYNCKRRMRSVYEAQRLAHLLELGAYPLLQENEFGAHTLFR